MTVIPSRRPDGGDPSFRVVVTGPEELECFALELEGRRYLMHARTVLDLHERLGAALELWRAEAVELLGFDPLPR